MASIHPTPEVFSIVCPLLFLAGFVDSIAGGGGLISLPAYMLTGMPMHQVLATNKLSSTCGTSVTTLRFILNGLVDLKLALPSVIAGIAGASIGSHISLMLSDIVIRRILIVVLPVAAFFVLNKKIFQQEDPAAAARQDETQQAPSKKGDWHPARRTYVIAALAALIIGMYDGLYGPGTGAFLIIAFTALAKKDVKRANAQAKVINLTSNVTALTVFLLNGQAAVLLGLAGAAANIAGNYLGSGLVMRRGARIVKPVLLVVLALLFVKVLTGS